MNRYVYGLDYASQDDFMATTINLIPEWTGETEKPPLPRLVALWGTQHESYDKTLDKLQKQLFRKFPPFFIVTDYTNEKTFTDILTRGYGKDMIEPVKFGAGLSGTKKMLKDDGLSILKMGYKFPNPAQQKDMKQREFLLQLITELQHEQMILTPGGMPSFKHPDNKHNDFAISWELSIHGCMKFILDPTSEPVAYAGGRVENKYDQAQEYLDELYEDPHINIKDVAIRQPKSYLDR